MIYENVKELCKAQGITIAELERRAKLANGTIKKWEENNNPKVQNLIEVAKILKVPVTGLLKK